MTTSRTELSTDTSLVYPELTDNLPLIQPLTPIKIIFDPLLHPDFTPTSPRSTPTSPQSLNLPGFLKIFEQKFEKFWVHIKTAKPNDDCSGKWNIEFMFFGELEPV